MRHGSRQVCLAWADATANAARQILMAGLRANSGPSAVPAGGWATRWAVGLAGHGIVLAVAAAYANSWAAPFVFDDLLGIVQNPTIRHLDRLGDVLSPPWFASGAAGRPLVNLSLAVNYALGGYDVKGYHVMNTLIHAVAALALLGVIRRTLLRPPLRVRYGAAALPLALAITLLWALHPLLTEAVTCVIYRSESLTGMLYLLTVYGFIRSVESPHPRRWRIFIVATCLLGMAAKETMVSAPVMLLLYDRTFVAGSFRAAWRERWKLYLALAATWLLLAWLVAGSYNRGGAASDDPAASAWLYALTQCRGILLYLRLALWPSPLVVDYGMTIAHRLAEVWWQAAILVALVAGTCWALVRRPPLGFVGFWFFAILAPSSSIVPIITQTLAEKRMYLSLATVVVLAVLAGYRWLGRRVMPLCVGLAIVAGWWTARRNEDYSSAMHLWALTVAEVPDNPRAQTTLGCLLAMEGRNAEAVPYLEEAVRLKPDYPDAQNNLGNVLFRQSRPTEALPHLEEAVRLRPTYFEAHFVLAGVLAQLGRNAEALAHLGTAVQLRPDSGEARQMLAETLARMGREAEAVDHYQRALRLQPGNPALEFGLGNVLSRLGRMDDAQAHFAAAVRLNPGSIPARFNLGYALFALRRFSEAAEQYAEVVRLRPDFAEAHNNLGNALLQLGRLDEARAQYEETLRLKPDFAEARDNLDRLELLRERGR